MPSPWEPPGLCRGGKAKRRAQKEQVLRSGAEFGHVESKAEGNMKETAGSADGVPVLAGSPF